jgi:hypothetical protein
MKKLVLIIAGTCISVIVFAQAPRTDLPDKKGETDPTILAPPPHAHPATPATMQRTDTPGYQQRGDTTRRYRDRDTTYYRRNRTDSLPRDDRDPNRMGRDSLRK